ncbi:hypothetical protein M431DRAFT_6382 [Trichoderma harzianum CBS 226.95]|uniref:Uncharacterized protein n=1 Tax=Trichoderma harzianum CBS 226.95 TaxID=983964 RepID=A0A2T4AAP4_TRIHA|nr:hypothetical protein M431DRAFT_6382 [Trichoderma harzianum CBS 226.95]PTB54147.1 hypothetical protein M431DRAFT_6382 [Trichoderma harzianum CBS 226.95]
MASLAPSAVDVNTETIVVASCLGGGLLLATALIVTIMIVKRRARLRKLQEKDLKMEATKAWAREGGGKLSITLIGGITFNLVED